MAPNIRIDWYPEGHFQDIQNPTHDELNSGYNLSCAITTGYTLDFTDPVSESSAPILDSYVVQNITRSSYEANLDFLLAPRDSNEGNEQAYRLAEQLFYNHNNNVGYLGKRFGYSADVAYGDSGDQRVDLFKVQADLPKVLSEDGEPILLNIRFIPQGCAASAVVTPWLPPMNTYLWEGPANNSTSAYYNENRELSKRNYILNPSFESNSLDSNLTIANMVEYKIVEEPFYGSRALWVVPNHNTSNPPQIQFRPVDNSSLQDAWMGFSLNLRLKANNVARAHMYIGYNNVRVSVVDKVISDEYVNIKVGPVQVPAGATNIRATLFLFDYISGNLGDEEVLIDGLQLVRGDSAAEVEYQLESYFDGNGEKPLPPPANDWDSQLKWEGAAHNSPSYLEVDGQIVARNLVHNPSFEIGTEGWDFESDFVGNGFVLSNNSNVKAGSSLGRVDSNRNGGGTYFTLKISNSALPKIDPSHKWVGGRFFFYAHRNSMGEGNSWVREVSLLDSDKNVLLTDIRESRIPATQDYQSWVLPNIVGAEYVQFKIHFNRVTPNTLNSYQYIDAVQITSSHTFEDLAQQLRIYMDGSTRPESAGILELTKPSTQYAWLGEPHNSPSVKLDHTGNIVARNLFSNPSFELGLEGVELSGNASLSHTGGLAVATGDYGMQVEINDASINGGWVRQVAPVSSDDWGKWVGWSAVVRRSINVSSLRWYYEVRQGGSVLSSGYMGSFPVDGTLLPDAPRHSFATQVDDGADEIRLWLRPTEALSYARYYTDGWLGVLSDSEPEALDQAATYFDGDTPDEYL